MKPRCVRCGDECPRLQEGVCAPCLAILDEQEAARLRREAATRPEREDQTLPDSDEVLGLREGTRGWSW